MQHGQSVISVNDGLLSDLIGTARRRVVYLAPGATRAVADALAKAGKLLGISAVNVIVDMDPEVYRLGYGTPDGLKAIGDSAQESILQLCSQPGVRIGLLIVDDTTLVFAPTPELIESATEKSSQPNAIMLGAPPVALAGDLGLGQQGVKERRIGLDAVSPADLNQVRTNLAQNPPERFDLARKVRIYNSYYQFVELELMNCYISRRKVKLPGYLVGLSTNPQLASRFQAQFNMFQGNALKVEVSDGQRYISETSLRKDRDAIAKNYLIQLTGFGMVIAKERKADFEVDVEKLRADVRLYMAGLDAQIKDHIDKTTQTLVEAFLPSVISHPPQPFLKFGTRGLTGEKIEQLLTDEMLTDEIKTILTQAMSVAEKMEVRRVYKDIALEAVQDEGFQAATKKAKLDLDAIFSQGTAVQAQPTQPTLFSPPQQDDESNGHS